MAVSIIIPAFNEEECISQVIAELSQYETLYDEILVVDGGSKDRTVTLAEKAGARVLHEPRRGYGRACHSGMLQAKGEILVFMDADGADDPRYLERLLIPIQNGTADLVLGSRLAGHVESGAMPWHQYFGNWLSAALIRVLYHYPVTDLSPFRALKKDFLESLDMQEMTYGWPTEMLVKAISQDRRILEIPVTSRNRIAGRSKISGTVKGTIFATYHIMRMIFRIWR